MQTFGAREAKNNFGALLDSAQREPVVIEKKGRPVAVVVSAEEYHRLEEAEDALWVLQALEAEKEGFVGAKESQKFLKELRDAKD